MIVSFLPIIEQFQGERLDLPRSDLSQTEAQTLDFTLAADASDEDIFPGKLTTVDALVLTADKAITYKVNGNATAITLDANGYVVKWGTAVTALTVSEPNTQAVRVRGWFWGA